MILQKCRTGFRNLEIHTNKVDGEDEFKSNVKFCSRVSFQNIYSRKDF